MHIKLLYLLFIGNFLAKPESELLHGKNSLKSFFLTLWATQRNLSPLLGQKSAQLFNQIEILKIFPFQKKIPVLDSSKLFF